MTTLYDAKFGNFLQATTVLGNVLVGAGAMASAHTSAAFNTCIGRAAGSVLSATNAFNTLIGSSASTVTGAVGGTAIGANASQKSSSATATSVALGYGATSTFNGACTLGLKADALRIVSYGPYIGLHYNQTVWQGLATMADGSTYTTTYTGGNINIPSGPQVLDGLSSLYQSGTSGSTATQTISLPSASSVIAALLDYKVGTAFYFKIGSYKNVGPRSLQLSTSAGGYTLFSGSFVVTGYNNGCKNYLFVVTSSSTISIFSCA